MLSKTSLAEEVREVIRYLERMWLERLKMIPIELQEIIVCGRINLEAV